MGTLSTERVTQALKVKQGTKVEDLELSVLSPTPRSSSAAPPTLPTEGTSERMCCFTPAHPQASSSPLLLSPTQSHMSPD